MVGRAGRGRARCTVPRMTRLVRPAVLAAVLAVGLVTSCGGSDSESGLLQDAMESNESGGAAGAESGSGGEAEVEDVEIDTGDVVVAQGTDIDLPDGFPSSIPLPQAGGPSLSGSYAEPGLWSLIYAMEDTSADVCNAYLESFPAAGFEESMRMENTGDFTAIYSSAEFDVVVSCGPTGGVTVQVTETEA